MAFCYLHDELSDCGTTTLSNLYISEFMPTMPDVPNKIYCMGLYLSSFPNSIQNREEYFLNKLGIDKKTFSDSLRLLVDTGLIQIINNSNIEIVFLPPHTAMSTKKYKPSAYKDFNAQIQNLITERVITPAEFNQYYEFFDEYHMEHDALILIAKYAVDMKGGNIGFHYILTIARNWAREGNLTMEQVDERMQEVDSISLSLIEVLKAAGITKKPDLDDRELYIKWTKNLNYSQDVLMTIAKKCKKGKGGINKIDARVTRYFTARLYTTDEINAFEKKATELRDLAFTITRKLGLYYENIEPVIDTYIQPWLGTFGFSADALIILSEVAFQRGIKSLEQFNDKLTQEWYKKGLVTVAAISQELSEIQATDLLIKEVYVSCASIDTTIHSRERDYYRTWSYSWNFSHDIILAVAEKFKGWAFPFSKIHQELALFRAKKITTLELAKNELSTKTYTPTQVSSTGLKPNEQRILSDQYTKEQLNALIDNIDEVVY